ncbi:coiled-coil-helix-coiled-coil-helix domain-containing protein 7 isoform X1 [Xenopus laevis]|uniref:Coiled-coil-helix-coiled-coil-helix domain-containing protein 7 n=3 Tax=Xenopus laevis TaxID=8355 RepID=CHCH7_XENLA|nr:coiled-coil-helix-coiled-coil-helix domain-containing protein 7 [Xenopus laevis]XP_018122210.1 coiled-coil-helix-coiled-coil-helix domain-containing protein 7 isoform X1 [Xenopus laevis]XP_018122211.1 coiled-coil-helix-coiled-coil-helix domain-containing protein 7 isoform X1 [Xenopus laevis]XP_018122212.1 coiled-coil-helix-coiled-coil-helix domain-containing protein 7 isoform X1 [Xenopus laevis]XP_041421514.1 coiled-coil-helix-coiled-coil-helix domain-containing protein 7 isoform X1 [Xenopus
MSRIRRMRDLDSNPCLEETDASTKCMDENQYQKDLCTSYFIKYKNCRKFWNGIMITRRREGTVPYMPAAEERKQILESLESLPY